MFGFIKHRKDGIDNTTLSTEQDSLVESEDLCEINYADTKADNYIYREHLADYHPSNNGLYPDEILMLFMASKYKTGNNDFPRYWEYNYKIKNPQEILTSLENRGFIQQGGLKETLSSLMVNDLKEELSANGLKTSGKKEELVNRLIDSVDCHVLETKFPNKPYKLTELGEDELKQNEYVIKIHSDNLCGGIWWMNHLLYFNNPEHLGYRDVLWREYVKSSLKNYRDGNFGLYASDYLRMYYHLMEEEKYETAFQMLAEVLYFDLSGLRNNMALFEQNMKHYLKLIIDVYLSSVIENPLNCIVSLSPAIVDYLLPNMKIKLNIVSDEEYYGVLLTKFKDVAERCPFHLFTPEESAKICIWEMNKDVEKLADIYRKAVLRIQKMYDEL